jgi:hypothetical protein
MPEREVAASLGQPIRDDRLEQRVLHGVADAPEQHADECDARAAKKDERRKECAGARAKGAEELAIDRRAAFVRCIAEQVHDAHREYERKRRRRADARRSPRRLCTRRRCVGRVLTHSTYSPLLDLRAGCA